MTSATLLVLAFLLGCVSGLRSMTGPAVVCWGAQLGWLPLDQTSLAFLSYRFSLVVFTILALGELIADKLPQIPNRTNPGPLAARAIFGAGCGAALCAAAQAPPLWGAIPGGLGGITGGFAGYFVRRWLTVTKYLPDLPVALAEDLIAVGGGICIVSRFALSLN